MIIEILKNQYIVTSTPNNASGVIEVGREKKYVVTVNPVVEHVVVQQGGSGGGGFTNGQSITVNNFVITGSFTANGEIGSNNYFLKSNGTSVYWSYGSDYPVGDYGDLSNTVDAFGVPLGEIYDCAAPGSLQEVDLGTI